MQNHPFDGRGIIYGLGALLLEVTGIASGAYVYGQFPLKVWGVPLSIPIMWILVAYLAYLMYGSFGIKGVFTVWLMDLFLLEPLAYLTGAWRWISPYSLLLVPFGTVANAIVWIGMIILGVIIFRGK